MIDAVEIKGHMEVVGADGAHIGKVDCMDGDLIRLACHAGEHGITLHSRRYVRLGDVTSLHGGRVWLGVRGSAARVVARKIAKEREA